MSRKGKKAFTTYMDNDIYDRLVELAAERHMSMSGIVTQLILDAEVQYPERIGQVTIDDVTNKGAHKRKERN